VLTPTLRALLARLGPVRGRMILAIDGIDGAGKTRFADAVALEAERSGIAVFRASIDGFHRPRVKRYARGRESGEGFYRDSYDYSAFKRSLIEPFRMGGSTAFVPAVFDVTRDSWVEPTWLTGPEDALLVVDGIFLHRPELRDLWNYSVWLEVDSAIAAERMRERDGESEAGERYATGQAIYIAEARPADVSSVIVDNNDFESPFIV